MQVNFLLPGHDFSQFVIKCLSSTGVRVLPKTLTPAPVLESGAPEQDMIVEMERNDPPMQLTTLDSSCWNKTGLGPSIAETMIKRGARWIPADRHRIAGKIEVHRRLACDDRGNPRVRFFSTCNNTIRTLPTLPISKTNPEDVDTKAEDHAYDALRYMVMSRTLMNVHTPHRMMKQTQQYEPQDQVFGY